MTDRTIRRPQYLRHMPSSTSPPPCLATKDIRILENVHAPGIILQVIAFCMEDPFLITGRLSKENITIPEVETSITCLHLPLNY